MRELLTSLALAIGAGTPSNSYVDIGGNQGTQAICYKVEEEAKSLVSCDPLIVSPDGISTFEILHLPSSQRVTISFIPIVDTNSSMSPANMPLTPIEREEPVNRPSAVLPNNVIDQRVRWVPRPRA